MIQLVKITQKKYMYIVICIYNIQFIYYIFFFFFWSKSFVAENNNTSTRKI